jgi:Domain of unknown function (DUF4403)
MLGLYNILKLINMKKINLTFILFIVTNFTALAQIVPEFEKPKVVTEEAKETLFQSKIFIPVEIEKQLINTILYEATPNKLASRVSSDVRDLNVNFKVSSGETKFGKTDINHLLTLENENTTYKSRNKKNRSWPFKGYKFSDWTQDQCNEIVSSGSANLLFRLGKDADFFPAIDIIADVDKVMCNQNDYAAMATLLNYQDYRNLFKTNLETELKKLDFKQNVTTTWDNLQNPFSINKELFITKKAQNIIYKDLRFEDEKLGKMNLGLLVNLSASKTGDPSLSEEKTALPELTKYTEKSKTTIAINLPFTASFALLKDKLKGKFSGEPIKGKNSAGKMRKFAKVTDVNFFGSDDEDYDFIIELNTNLVNKSVKEQIAPIYIHAKLAFDTIKKNVYINQYVVDELSKKALDKYEAQPITNKFSYSKIISKFQFKIDDLIDNQKKITKSIKLNKIDICNGVKLKKVSTALELNKVIPQPDRLFCIFILRGVPEVDILKITKKVQK